MTMTPMRTTGQWPRLLKDLMAMTPMRTNWSQLQRELMDKSQMRDNDHDSIES